MRDRKHKITAAGLQELESEKKIRETEKREELALLVEDMRDKGDLSENDGYTLAIEEYQSNEARVAELEAMIDNAEVVSGGTSGVVGIGSTVKVKAPTGEKVYTIVGPAESNPMDGLISDETPIGSALVGRKAGDVISVTLPAGEVEYEVIEVS